MCGFNIQSNANSHPLEMPIVTTSNLCGKSAQSHEIMPAFIEKAQWVCLFENAILKEYSGSWSGKEKPKCLNTLLHSIRPAFLFSKVKGETSN